MKRQKQYPMDGPPMWVQRMMLEPAKHLIELLRYADEAEKQGMRQETIQSIRNAIK